MRPQLKTHCVKGHEYVVGSYREYPGSGKGRHCLECARIRSKAYYDKKLRKGELSVKLTAAKFWAAANEVLPPEHDHAGVMRELLEKLGIGG